MVIAVIDDGINPNFFPIIKDLEFDLQCIDDAITPIEREKKQSSTLLSHGTIIAAIIKKYAENAKIGSIKVLQENESCNINILNEALVWCYQNNIKLIHMSLGSKRMVDYYNLFNIINKLYKKGSILVAATSNFSQFSVPACYSCVISVKTDARLLYANESFTAGEIELDGIDFVATSQHILYNYNNLEYYTPICNSFAAPYITAQIFNLLESNQIINVANVKNTLCPDHKFIVTRPDFNNSISGFTFKKNCNECFGDGTLFWSPSLYKSLIKSCKFDEGKLLTPIILIVGSACQIIELSIELNSMFTNARFDSKIFTTICYCNYLVDWIPYTDASKISSFLFRQVNFFNLDVAILCAEYLDPAYKDYQFKIILTNDGELSVDSNLFFVPKDFKRDDVTSIFNRLITES